MNRYIQDKQTITFILLKYCLLFILIEINFLHANNAYYEHRMSQFQLMSKHEKKIIMLGDSITDRGLWDELTMRHDISNRGIDNDTSNGVLERLDLLNKNAKQVFIMIGINDILRGKTAKYIFDNYKKLLMKIKEKNIIPVIQSTLYVGKKAPRRYNKEVKKLNLLLQNYAQEKNILYIDLNLVLASNDFLPKEYSLDGLHLNGKAYIIWAQILKPYLLAP